MIRFEGVVFYKLDRMPTLFAAIAINYADVTRICEQSSRLWCVDSVCFCVLVRHMPSDHSTPHALGWVHTCNTTAYRNTVSWQCGRDSWPRNVSKVGYAVTLRACSVCCRYLAVASKGWYGYGLSRCGRETSRCMSTPAHAVTISSLWCDGQIPTAHRTSP
jgi:hypothetical protein